MLRFFRGKRQNSGKQDGLGKYLMYAVGEIILVVIGILIALSANDYSERQKALKQSNIYLQDMLEDLASDTLYLNVMLSKIEEQLGLEEWLLHKDKLGIDDIDSLRLAVSNIKWTFNINDRSFLNIQNSNEIKLVGHEELYSKISKYYLSTKERITQNNQMEQQKMATKNEFEQIINRNLLITGREYMDYTGVQVEIDFPDSSSSENFKQIIANLSTIQTKNSLNEKYARHNFIYVALHFCAFEAKQLIKSINISLSVQK